MREIREEGAYAIADAARYLRIPVSTLRAWCFGQPIGRKEFKPLISMPPGEPKALSFMNLVEVYVLDAIRKRHGLPLQKVRKALIYLKKNFPSKHPLADQDFETDGINLFIEEYGSLINISESGQTEMKEAIRTYLKRIERDTRGIPIRLYPFIRTKNKSEPKAIVIDPAISFGRPVVVGTGVPTAIIFERFSAGDSIKDLQADYKLSPSQIEEALRCERFFRAA